MRPKYPRSQPLGGNPAAWSGLPRSEHLARAEITIPLFPEMDEATQDRVVDALADALA